MLVSIKGGFMQFPYKPKAVDHKHGGHITEITGLGHVTDKPKEGRSRDYWHFFGNVTWRDGTQSKGIEIAPYALCQDSDEGHAEVIELMEAMNAYLREHGEWCDSKSKHEGWYAHERAVRRRA
jgi:hypothetical protein